MSHVVEAGMPHVAIGYGVCVAFFFFYFFFFFFFFFYFFVFFLLFKYLPEVFFYRPRFFNIDTQKK